MSAPTWQTRSVRVSFGYEKPEDRQPPVEGQLGGGRLRIEAQVVGESPDLGGCQQAAKAPAK